MIQSAKATCVDRQRAQELALNAINQIIAEYEQEIAKLSQMLTERETKLAQMGHRVAQLEVSISEKQDQLRTCKQQEERKMKSFNDLLVASYKEKDSLQLQFEKKRQQLYEQLLVLKQELSLKEKEIFEIKERLKPDLSLSLSSISKKDQSFNRTYSIDLTESFQSYPDTTMKLLNSLPDYEKPSEAAERGDMSCLLISRDNMSAQKYVEINRTFLKRKLKQEEKRFRFVIIYKPDKAS